MKQYAWLAQCSLTTEVGTTASQHGVVAANAVEAINKITAAHPGIEVTSVYRQLEITIQ